MKIVWGRSIGFNMDLNSSENNMEITFLTKGCDCYTWREVYAWLPVKTINNKRVWFKKVYKRKMWAMWGRGFHMEPEVQYGTLFDTLNDPFANRIID